MPDGSFVDCMMSIRAKIFAIEYGISEITAELVTIGDLPKGSRFRLRDENGWSEVIEK